MNDNPKALKILLDLSKKEKIKEYLLVIYGQVNQEIIISAIKLMEHKLQLEKFSRSIISKMKIISAEVLQNIVKHQELDEANPPYFIMGLNGTALILLAGNVLTEEKMKAVSEKVEAYKKIDGEKLRDFYVETFKKAELTGEGNAGLGLLDIVYRAEQNVECRTGKAANGKHTLELNIIIKPGEMGQSNNHENG